MDTGARGAHPIRYEVNVGWMGVDGNGWAVDGSESESGDSEAATKSRNRETTQSGGFHLGSIVASGGLLSLQPKS